ncbi:MAG: hypothetical protein ABSE45_15065 [Candidatus Acidiferrales bacterium]|jgi:cell wall-associated NlpC family hydrolase
MRPFDPELVAEWREDVVREARSWVGTSYHTKGFVKGAGADCFTFMASVFIEQGLFSFEDLDLPPYHEDWWANVAEDEYRKLLLRRANKMYDAVTYPSTNVLPGNIITQKRPDGKVNWHGAIVTSWPLAVHAIAPAIEEVDVSRDPFWAFKQIEIFDPWERLKNDRR